MVYNNVKDFDTTAMFATRSPGRLARKAQNGTVADSPSPGEYVVGI